MLLTDTHNGDRDGEDPRGRALGHALREARVDKGLTTRELGARLKRDHGVVSRWETGERTAKPEQVAQILTVLGVDGDQYDEIIALSYANPVVQLESRTSSLLLHENADVAAYRRAADKVSQVAMSHTDTIEVIAQVTRRVERSQ